MKGHELLYYIYKTSKGCHFVRSQERDIYPSQNSYQKEVLANHIIILKILKFIVFTKSMPLVWHPDPQAQLGLGL